MTALTGSSSLSRRKKANKESGESKITTVKSRRNVTTGTSPIPIRLSENDKADLNLWLEELSETSGKKITMAKLIRGMVFMRKKVNTKKLLEAIKEAN
jgi:hypothetical protein